MACVTWLSFGDYVDIDGAYDKSVFAIQQMVDEISACIPFHMHYELQPMAKEMGQEQNGMDILPHDGFDRLCSQTCSC